MMEDDHQMTTSPPQHPPAAAERRPTGPGGGGTPVETARARFEEALLALREIADPAVQIRRAHDQLATALRECYLALARRTDHHAYRAALDAAAEATRGV